MEFKARMNESLLPHTTRTGCNTTTDVHLYKVTIKYQKYRLCLLKLLQKYFYLSFYFKFVIFNNLLLKGVHDMTLKAI